VSFWHGSILAEGGVAERRGKPGERSGLAALTGGGPSTVGVVGAMRARDVSKPTERDAAAAERKVVIRRVPADQPLKPPKDKPKPATPGEPRTP
jgi:hypothetical protein